MATVDTASTADLDAAYDYVVVGGGTSGLVVASRLTAYKDVRVLVLEAGANRLSDPKISIQALAAATYHDPDYDWCMTTEPQASNRNCSFTVCSLTCLLTCKD
jgi:choline dehydrogenase-like flavoprotein